MIRSQFVNEPHSCERYGLPPHAGRNTWGKNKMNGCTPFKKDKLCWAGERRGAHLWASHNQHRGDINANISTLLLSDVQNFKRKIGLRSLHWVQSKCSSNKSSADFCKEITDGKKYFTEWPHVQPSSCRNRCWENKKDPPLHDAMEGEKGGDRNGPVGTIFYRYPTEVHADGGGFRTYCRNHEPGHAWDGG